MKYSKLEKQQVINDIKNNNVSIIDLSKFKDDKDVMLEAVKNYGLALKYASNRLRDDKDVVLEAVKTDVVAINYVSKRLKDDKDVVLEAVKTDVIAIKYASERLKDDEDIILEAVKHSPLMLYYASERINNDKELLKILEKKEFNKNWRPEYKKWYQERMEVLANIRRLEEKELIEKFIIPSNKTSKKNKF